MSASASSRKTIIFKEAARIFREKGYNGSSLRDLAKRAGVQGGSIYHHFSSKQEILYMIMECTMTTLILNVRQAIEGVERPLDRLRKAIQFHIEYHTIDTDETYVTDSELRSLEPANYTKIVALRNRYERVFREIMAEGLARGEMHIDDVNLASKALLQMCTGISYWYTPAGEKSISDIAKQYIDLFFWGICRGKQGRQTGESDDRQAHLNR
ncbi:MAG: TetR/AcrR family transcriptional regulator [Desulfoprunum sp.]|nr:TetR/AcrR family transcriptional regulator [Desulfoprunum sp.]